MQPYLFYNYPDGISSLKKLLAFLSKDYLGLITDTVEMKYYASKWKIDLLSSMLKDCLHNISQNISFKARDLPSLLEKINALAKSHGNFVYMCRETQLLLDKAVFTNGWKTNVTLNCLAFKELMFLANHLNFINMNNMKIRPEGELPCATPQNISK